LPVVELFATMGLPSTAIGPDRAQDRPLAPVSPTDAKHNSPPPLTSPSTEDVIKTKRGDVIAVAGTDGLWISAVVNAKGRSPSEAVPICWMEELSDGTLQLLKVKNKKKKKFELYTACVANNTIIGRHIYNLNRICMYMYTHIYAYI
jgi:hypothetical protein